MTRHVHPARKEVRMTVTDDDALAEAYNRALDLEKAGDQEAAAAAYREVLALDPADHGGASVRLAAMGLGETPPKAPDAYVTTLFDQHAEVFDAVLVDELGYCVPLQVHQMLLERAPGRRFARMLDLGCGTGLSGEAMRDIVDHAIGVDISENMVELSDEREVYEELYVGEAVAFLQDAGDLEPFDLVVATDVFPYLGAAEPFVDGVAAVTISGGLFAFSTESLPEGILAGRAFMVGPKQRFAHAEPYLRAVLAAAAFDVVAWEPIIVRSDEGTPVHGDLVLARKR